MMCADALPQELPDPALEFLADHFGDGREPLPISLDEAAIVDDVLEYVENRFGGMKYILGLAIDFTVLAQRLSIVDAEARGPRPELTEQELFERYTLVEKVGVKTANTLSLKFRDARKEGIRKIEEQVAALFHKLNRSGYPSACVYNTGQWQKYKDLLVKCFRLSENARLVLCRRLIETCLARLEENVYYGRAEPRMRLFEQVLDEYPRTDSNENGGLTFQAMAYGFVSADRHHLELLAAGVRTGSARQRRFGDIDGYMGPGLELSVEVKDIPITEDNFPKELSGFVNEVEAAGIMGMAVLETVADSVRERLVAANVVPLTEAELRGTVTTWDWPKQDRALLGMLHYLAHIEQNPLAVKRLLEFVREYDPKHDVLAFLREPS